MATKTAKSGEGTSFLPLTRKMTVVAQDPSVRRRDGSILMATIDVPGEDLIPGPIGYRVQVVDYDASTGKYRKAHSLPAAVEKEPEAWAQGRASIVGDFRFHAQNTYALVMKTLARFEFALGRRVGWAFKVHQLKAAPNGIMEPNAFYSRDIEGLVFGYFKGISNATVYTCLSHDIVVHETTHALLDAIRERYLDPSGPDQAAFHEGFADVIALLSVYSQVELVEWLLLRSSKGRNKGELTDGEVSSESLRKTALFGLAKEMGKEMEAVRSDALRRSAEMRPGVDWKDDPEFEEPHRRGEVLVAAVMNGFLEAWTSRLQKAKVQGQRTHNVRRVAEEGADIAAWLVTMWIRALDYMPPVHLEFSDALSAALTADMEVRPDDHRFDLRRHMKQSFLGYGIRPASRSMPDGTWRNETLPLRYDRVRFESMRSDKDEVFRFLWDNRHALDIDLEDAYAEVLSVRPCTRVGVDGFTLHETVAVYYQVARLTPMELAAKGIRLPKDYAAELSARRAADRNPAPEGDGDEPAAVEDEASETVTPVYGGGALIFDEYGKLKYHVKNSVFSRFQTARLRYLFETGHLRVERDGARLSPSRLSDLHRRRALSARRFPSEGW